MILLVKWCRIKALFFYICLFYSPISVQGLGWKKRRETASNASSSPSERWEGVAVTPLRGQQAKPDCCSGSQTRQPQSDRAPYWEDGEEAFDRVPVGTQLPSCPLSQEPCVISPEWKAYGRVARKPVWLLLMTVSLYLVITMRTFRELSHLHLTILYELCTNIAPTLWSRRLKPTVIK